MGKKLFPKEIIDDSSEANFSKHSVQTKLIYITVLIAFVSIFIALPLIHVTISVKSPGIVQPLTNRSQLVSLVSGQIEELYIEENGSVVRGQTVAKISAPVLVEQNSFNMQRQEKVSGYLSDLSLLLDIDESWFISTALPVDAIESERDIENEGAQNENVSNTENDAPPTEFPSPLLQFRDQMLAFKNQILNATPAAEDESLSSGADSNRNSKNALQKARTGLWKLVNMDTSYLLAPGQEDNIYQQALTRFEQQISGPVQSVREALETHNQNKQSYKDGRIDATEYAENQQNLQEAWEQLLITLENSSLARLTDPVSEEENDINTTADDDNPTESEASITEPEPKELDLETAKYRSSLLEFKQQARNNIREIRMAQIKYNRDQQLYERGVISEENFEASDFALENAQNDFQLLFEQQRNQWQADQTAYQDELEQLGSDREQISQEQDRHIITAPISGTIQNMQGIYEGSSVAANQALAEISPDTSLIVEAYVPPKDIGLLREGMEARFQISAYDYNQWGLLTGTVEEISGDVIIVNDQPVFKVRASLDQTWLELQNGYRGNLKKGMSLLARFKVTERSLFQLLYDNLDDWLNPKWDDSNSAQVPAQQASASM